MADSGGDDIDFIDRKSHPLLSNVAYPYRTQREIYLWCVSYRQERNIGWRKLSREICEASSQDWDTTFYYMIENWGRNRGKIQDTESFDAICFYKDIIQGRNRRANSLSASDILDFIEQRFSAPSEYITITQDVFRKEVCGLWRAMSTSRNKDRKLRKSEIVMSISEINSRPNLFQVKMAAFQDNEMRDVPLCGVMSRFGPFVFMFYLWSSEDYSFFPGAGSISISGSEPTMITMGSADAMASPAFLDRTPHERARALDFWTFDRLMRYDIVSINAGTIFPGSVNREHPGGIEPYLTLIDSFEWRIAE